MQLGDRFVLRETSGDSTLGGGEILDPAPLHHRRRRPGLVERLAAISHEKLSGLISAEVRKYPAGAALEGVAEVLNVAAEDVAAAEVPGITRLDNKNGGSFLITDEAYERLRSRVLEECGRYHKENPLSDGGRALEELPGLLGMGRGAEDREILSVVLQRLEGEGALKKAGNTWALPSHAVAVSPDLQRQISALDSFFKGCGMSAPTGADLSAAAAMAGIDERTAKQALHYMAGRRMIYKAENTWLHASVVDRSRTQLLKALDRTPGGMTVAQFRDLVGGNRKICLLLYGLFDEEGVTRREGDVRVITEKGRKVLADACPPCGL
jgi:selenocysteine-specific elongation factor